MKPRSFEEKQGKPDNKTYYIVSRNLSFKLIFILLNAVIFIFLLVIMQYSCDTNTFPSSVTEEEEKKKKRKAIVFFLLVFCLCTYSGIVTREDLAIYCFKH